MSFFELTKKKIIQIDKFVHVIGSLSRFIYNPLKEHGVAVHSWLIKIFERYSSKKKKPKVVLLIIEVICLNFMIIRVLHIYLKSLIYMFVFDIL